MPRWTLFEPLIPPALRRDVSHVRVFQNLDPRPFWVKVAPIAVPGIVFHQKGQGPAIRSIATQVRTTRRLPLAFVYGAGIVPSTMSYTGGPHVTIQVILKPHGLRSLLGLDAERLRNAVLPLSAIQGAPSLAGLLRARTSRAKAKLMLDFLMAKARKSSTHDDLVAEGLELVERMISDISLPEILATLRISERQFERRFVRAVGITPKTYLRVRRFNEAIRLMKTRRYKTLTEIAHALHFSDQSHFIRDLKAFSRITPRGIYQRVEQFHEQGGFSYDI